MSSPLRSLISTGTKLWLDSIDPDLVASNRALGATGAMETAICALALERGCLPGTANLINLDPACNLDIIPQGGQNRHVSHLLCNAFGFGGVNASLLLSSV